MKCSECCENLYHLAGNGSDSLAMALKTHIAGCPSCYAEYEAMMDVIAVLRPKGTVKAPASLKEKILQQAGQPVLQTGKVAAIKPFWKKLAVAAAIITLIMITPFVFKKGGGQARASDLFMIAINAGKNIRNFVITFAVRTDEKDNFDYIDPAKPMVAHTLLRSFENPAGWSIKKSGRTAVFDGTSQYLYIPSVKAVYKGGENAGFVSWMRLLLDPESILWKEKENAESSGAVIKLFGKNGDTCLTITTKASGSFINDYLRNESIGTADSRREYVFDGKTHLLKELHIYLLAEKKEVLVFSLSSILYNTQIDPAAFSFTVPPDAEVKTAADLEPPQKNSTSGISSRDAVRMALEDLSKGDFETHKYTWGEYSRFGLELLHKNYGSFKVLHIGEPFRSEAVSGDIVPYEIQLENGYIKKFRLVVDSNNAAKTWMVKGGL